MGPDSENLPEPRSLYRHYKGKLYRIIGHARHTESLEMMVVYEAQYDDPQFGRNAIWVRPAAMWTADVQWEGKTVKRFTLVIPKFTVPKLEINDFYA